MKSENHKKIYEVIVLISIPFVKINNLFTNYTYVYTISNFILGYILSK